MTADTPPRVFISHTAADREVADALSSAVESLTLGKVAVTYSSKRGGEGAIRAGADWFAWIAEQVRMSQVTVVLLTPTSVTKPWPLWETGAIFGAALAQFGAVERQIRPLLFRLGSEDIPDPLKAANLQALQGDNTVDMTQFLSELVGDVDVLNDQQLLSAGRKLPGVVEAYLQQVNEALDRHPPAPLESAVEALPTLERALSLTITALQALAPTVKINGRYFHAVSEAGRDYLDRDDEVYHESVWMKEFGLPRVDVERNADALVICQSFLRRVPIYKVLTPDIVEQYQDEVRAHIDPSQGWVLACPVLTKAEKPLGVICLYGKKPPARNDAEVARLMQVAEALSDVFARTLQGTGVSPGHRLGPRGA